MKRNELNFELKKLEQKELNPKLVDLILIKAEINKIEKYDKNIVN